jgi:hypothetical protein
MPDWVGPWVITAAAIWLIQPLIRWIHKHLQGLGLLLTNDPKGAVLIYYLSLLPGVFLHELTQWLLAIILRVKIKRFQLWPEKQKGGLIRLGLVDIDDNTDVVRATLIGFVPVLVGIIVVALIGAAHFNTDALLSSVMTGDLPTMTAGIGQFVGAPDFWLWVYLVFAIANAMLPEEQDRINWWVLAGALAVVAIFLWLLDLGILVQAGLDGPLAQLARMMSLALTLSLAIDLGVMALISLVELIFSRFVNREVHYQ